MHGVDFCAVYVEFVHDCQWSIVHCQSILSIVNVSRVNALIVSGVSALSMKSRFCHWSLYIFSGASTVLMQGHLGFV